MKIEYTSLDQLFLDPLNPRLGRNHIDRDRQQADILEQMSDWTLDELATSFVESGFWAQEALIVTEELIYGQSSLVVIEGNRRLAALKMLQDAISGNLRDRKWRDIAQRASNLPPNFFEKIPFIKVESRDKVSAFLGFRHVTGIKEWDPAEKAQFISYLIDHEKLSYEQVMRRIGSKTTTVRSHYIAYKLLLQMEETEEIAINRIEDKFSVLYLSLRTAGVQSYLGLDLKAEPKDAASPVPAGNEDRLINYARWMFGDDKTQPLFTDSRNIDKFGKILLSQEAVTYLQSSPSPNFDLAVKKAGGDTEEILSLLIQASDNLEIAFSTLHTHVDVPDVQRIAKRLALHLVQITKIFPELKNTVQDKL